MVSDEVLMRALNIQSMEPLMMILVFFFGMIIFILFLSLLKYIIEGRTAKYRQIFADLYIVGTIRKFAKEDGIDLNEELKEIRRFEKIEKASMRSIDRQIEVELNEKISAKNQKIIDAINKADAQDLVDLT